MSYGVEPDRPIRAEFSMVSFGAVLFDDQLNKRSTEKCASSPSFVAKVFTPLPS